MSSTQENGKRNGQEAGAEQALRDSELNYRRLFESAQDGILILDADTGRVNDVNPFLIELLGFSHAEMVGHTVGELSPFRDIVSNQAVLKRLQKDGYVRYEDLPLETKAGRKVAVEFVSNVYRVGDKKVIQCNIRDITARKQADEVIRQQVKLQEQIAQIAATVPGMIFSFELRPDGSTRIPYASGALKTIFELQAAEVSEDATPVFSMIHPDDANIYRGSLAEHFSP